MECKFSSKWKYKGFGYSFILTTWNVNGEDKFFSAIAEKRFILTTWNVNAIAISGLALTTLVLS